MLVGAQIHFFRMLCPTLAARLTTVFTTNGSVATSTHGRVFALLTLIAFVKHLHSFVDPSCHSFPALGQRERSKPRTPRRCQKARSAWTVCSCLWNKDLK